MELLTEVEKKLPQLYVEKLLMRKKIIKIKLRFGEMENKQEVFYILMTAWMVL